MRVEQSIHGSKELWRIILGRDGHAVNGSIVLVSCTCAHRRPARSRYCSRKEGAVRRLQAEPFGGVVAVVTVVVARIHRGRGGRRGWDQNTVLRVIVEIDFCT